jgi:hypothetical protein
MSILFIRFGWFILGALFGAWLMSDASRSLYLSSSLNTIITSLLTFIKTILNSFGL